MERVVEEMVVEEENKYYKNLWVKMGESGSVWGKEILRIF
jgi:hypothetical protein